MVCTYIYNRVIHCGIISAYGSIPGSPIRPKRSLRLAVRTPASHAGNRGSIPLGRAIFPMTYVRGDSSVLRFT